MKYEVIVQLIEIYKVDVEADSEEDAIVIADNMLEGDNRYEYHWDSDAEFTVYEV